MTEPTSEISGVSQPHTPARSRRTARRATFVIALGAAILFVAGYRPPRSLAHKPFVADSAYGAVAPEVELAESAFGRSGSVHAHFALPGERVVCPLQLGGDTTNLAYAWMRIADSLPADSARPFTGDTLVAPSVPGLYRLTLVRHGVRRIVDALTLAVLVPFEDKKGPVLDGYRIGIYPAERRGRGAHDRPAGFVRVMPEELDLPVSKHLRLGDLLARDGQETWPRFVAVSPRMLDKIELVVDRIARSLSARQMQVVVNVHSGFRTPAYNRRVSRAARESRHQYGDAVDVAIDANGDGRLDARDARLVAAAVDSVEREYPDLVGGMGLYASGRYRHPYVHIDARGKRVRWRG